MRLRQIALVARDRDPVVADLCAVLGIEVGFVDPGVASFGLHNAVLPIGDTFLEVVSPVHENTTAGRLLDRRGGDGGYMVIVQTDDLEADRRRMAERSVRIVWEVNLDDAAAIHLHPRDVGAAILSFDHMDPPESWRWAGPSWKSAVRTEVTQAIVGAELQSPDPERLAARWSEVIDRPLERAGEELWIRLDSGTLRFVAETDGRGEGVSGIDLRVVDPQRLLDAARGRGLPVDGMSVQPSPDLSLGSSLSLAFGANNRAAPLLIDAVVERDDGDRGLWLRFEEVQPETKRRLEALIADLPAIDTLDEDGCEPVRVVLAEALPEEPV